MTSNGLITRFVAFDKATEAPVQHTERATRNGAILAALGWSKEQGDSAIPEMMERWRTQQEFGVRSFRVARADRAAC